MAVTVSGEPIRAPERGRVFEGGARGRLGDVTAEGRVRLDTLARWVQDVAYDDIADAGLASLGAWVVRRMRLIVRRFPRFDEQVALHTFCTGIGPRWAQRGTTMRGPDGGDVDADTLWIYLDPKTLQPARFQPVYLEVFGEAAGGRRPERPRLRHPSPPPEAPSSPWRFRAADLDLAGHVNNAAYWELLEERLEPEAEPLDAEFEYREAAQPGPALAVADGQALWVTTPGGEVHASVMVAGAG